MHIPHIGDTVLVHHKDCHSNGARIVPALVTQVFNQDSEDWAKVPIMCNLTAFPPFCTAQHLGSVTFFASTPLIKDEHFVGCWPKQEHHVHVGEREDAS